MRSESPGEARTKATSSKALLAIMIVAFFCSGYQGDLGITGSKPQHAILQASDVAKVPVILEGRVISNGAPVGPVRNSPLDGRPAQLWKARVRVENVLQGQVDKPDVDIFYFIGDIPGSARSIRLRDGDRNIFFLRRDGTRLRTNNDRSANSCLLPVKTGPHPNFRKASGSSINEAIISLLLTRGIGIDDKTMIAAIEQPEYSRFVGDDQVVKTVQHLAQEETPLVKEAACTKLLFWRHACGQEFDAPAVTIRNLTHPGSSGTFQLGDRIRTDLVGQAHQAVYRSGIGRVGVTDGNGHFTLTETTRNLPQATHTDVWMVGAEELSPAVSYVATGHGNRGWINTTVIGKPRDRYGMGMSALSVTGATVITYSAMLLDYRTSLYYEAEEVDTLYEDGKPIRTGRRLGSASATQFWETKVTTWNDYFLQSGHHAVAALHSNSFVNPIKFAEGSCFGMGSNCQIVRLDGPAKATKAAIFLGNTGADQMAVPQAADWKQVVKTLDSNSQSAVLDALLTRTDGSDDVSMIDRIDMVVHEYEFGKDLVVKKLQEMADRETPAVRAEACRELRRMHHPCGKRSGPPPAFIRPVPQRTKPASTAPPEVNRLQTAIPTYIVYANFLLMIHRMNEDKFASAFGLVSLRRAQLDALRDQASALTSELAMLDLRAQNVTSAFRTIANLAIANGKPLPQAPDAICRLQAMRTAAMVSHTVGVQAILGPKSTLNFEAMLAYRFTPESRFEALAPGGRR